MPLANAATNACSRRGGSLGKSLNAAASQFEALVIFAVVEPLAATRARDGTTIAAAARKLGKTMGARVNPTGARRRQSDSVTRFRLPDRARFGAELGCVAARQILNVKPQVNHFVFQYFAQSLVAIAAGDSANRILRAEKRGRALARMIESVDQQRHGQLDQGAPHIDVARRARQSAAPHNAARRQNIIKINRVETLILFLQNAFVGDISTHVGAKSRVRLWAFGDFHFIESRAMSKPDARNSTEVPFLKQNADGKREKPPRYVSRRFFS